MGREAKKHAPYGREARGLHKRGSRLPKTSENDCFAENQKINEAGSVVRWWTSSPDRTSPVAWPVKASWITAATVDNVMSNFPASRDSSVSEHQEKSVCWLGNE